MDQCFEYKICLEFLSRSDDEQLLNTWRIKHPSPFSLIMAEGFEERSLGVLKSIASAGLKLENLIIGRYTADYDLNNKYRAALEDLASIVAPSKWEVMDNHNDGLWVNDALNNLNSETIIIDITSMSNRSLFGGLDKALISGKNIFIGYSEADIYWPRKADWQELESNLENADKLADIVETKPWLFSYEHSVELVLNHEGYDSGGSRRALIAFLPFKSARLGVILDQEDFSECLFIAGCPHLEDKRWRLDALKKINESIIKNWSVVEMKTFGYRKTFEEMTKILFAEDSLLDKYDIKLAILGSKLQTVACWALSNIIPSITVITSTPAKYYPEAFSEGIGESWIFELPKPKGM